VATVRIGVHGSGPVQIAVLLAGDGECPRPRGSCRRAALTLAYATHVVIARERVAATASEHAWLWDHLVALRGLVTAEAFEAWTLQAALAALTVRVKLGVIVTNNTIRHPALLANMAATVDQISGGRLVLGIGSGGSANPDPRVLELVRREYGAFGLDMVPPGAAVGALGEACALIRRLWIETEPFDFDGQRYVFRGAICEPKPVQRPHPPILIAATRPRSLGIVARHGDIWSFPGGADVAEFRRLSQILDDECTAIGRNPAAILRSAQVIVAPVATTVPAAGAVRRRCEPSRPGPCRARDGPSGGSACRRGGRAGALRARGPARRHGLKRRAAVGRFLFAPGATPARPALALASPDWGRLPYWVCGRRGIQRGTVPR
jgi:alkanesulfonate monooxygenase SsuD/methylene tetrahydromethanopterin reductase-like flavin-dependent oxidoreductase (luciferase family)